ncbi:MAG: SDR family oxidoreductase [bacterium]|nr:SDR family oxidoreductase [bacterium]
MKRIFISGGTSGIGRSTVQIFLDNGYTVGTTARNSEKKAALLNSIDANQRNLDVQIVDLGDAKSFRDIEGFLSEFDPEILINNAAMYSGNNLIETTQLEIDSMFTTNFSSVVFLSKACINNWINQNKKGLILNIGSTLGNKPAPGTSLYSASKAALVSLTQSIAMEHAPKVRANIIMPGVVATPIHAKVMGADAASKFQSDMSTMHPLGRIGTPQEFAEMLYQLSQPSFAWMTGSILNIDGGISLIS